MKYKGYSVVYDYRNRNSVYRVEVGNIISRWPSFASAARYVLTLRTQKVAFMNELFREMAGMTIEQVAPVFEAIERVISARGESRRMTEDDDYRRFHGESLPRYRKWADEALEAAGVAVRINDVEMFLD